MVPYETPIISKQNVITVKSDSNDPPKVAIPRN